MTCKHECGFEGQHTVCQCVECGHEWSNPEMTESTNEQCPTCGSDIKAGCLMPCWFKPDPWHASDAPAAPHDTPAPSAELLQTEGKEEA